MNHLAIPVSDQARSRRFYETYFGFGYGVAAIEESDEPAYLSIKCRDPDGYIVEAFWEPLEKP